MARQLRIEYEDALYHVVASIFCESLALFDVQCLVLVLMRTQLSCDSANFEAEPEYIHASPQCGLQHIL